SSSRETAGSNQVTPSAPRSYNRARREPRKTLPRYLTIMPSTGGAAVPRKRAGLVAYASCIRYRDVVILQGSPLLGMAFSVRELTHEKIVSMVVCTLASSLLVAHIFSFNDWAGIALDSNDPNKSADVFVTRGISRHGVAALSLGLLAASLFLLALLPLS